MLQIALPDVRTALAKAVTARRKAVCAPTTGMRDFWLQMEGKWLRLARSYEHADRTTVYLNSRRRRTDESHS
jgi:hypothetical protein